MLLSFGPPCHSDGGGAAAVAAVAQRPHTPPTCTPQNLKHWSSAAHRRRQPAWWRRPHCRQPVKMRPTAAQPGALARGLCALSLCATLRGQSPAECEWAIPGRDPCFDQPSMILIGGVESPTACTDAVQNNAGVCSQSPFIRMYCEVTCGLCEQIVGCTDISALNYNCSSEVDAADGPAKCTYSGCINATAGNYNASASVDDGSCRFCEPGYSGWECDEDMNECLSAPCGGGGSCVDSTGHSSVVFGDYVCTCGAGWYGENCAADTNECLSSPCAHGECSDSSSSLGSSVAIDAFSCQCSAGW